MAERITVHGPLTPLSSNPFAIAPCTRRIVLQTLCLLPKRKRHGPWHSHSSAPRLPRSLVALSQCVRDAAIASKKMRARGAAHAARDPTLCSRGSRTRARFSACGAASLLIRIRPAFRGSRLSTRRARRSRSRASRRPARTFPRLGRSSFNSTAPSCRSAAWSEPPRRSRSRSRLR